MEKVVEQFIQVAAKMGLKVNEKKSNTMLFTNNDTIESSLEQYLVDQVHRSLQTNHDRITTFVLGDLETDTLRPLFYLTSIDGNTKRAAYPWLLLLVCGGHPRCGCFGKEPVAEEKGNQRTLQGVADCD
ncbi:unnamed protein product [Acanthoscelides obtectus]|uniref:Uncharacterized protein n=1 Tax=Acanthoscelides obtectus TaxID=200917 RepID=A0A9P0P319_ACAOB|nr:unnamed protein product [Acanthoscelides obtectus]CAK1651923.1 hypothetical protein AOBTE_LOCUS17545 [Acanthoscelides obtectus]